MIPFAHSGSPPNKDDLDDVEDRNANVNGETSSNSGGVVVSALVVPVTVTLAVVALSVAAIFTLNQASKTKVILTQVLSMVDDTKPV